LPVPYHVLTPVERRRRPRRRGLLVLVVALAACAAAAFLAVRHFHGHAAPAAAAAARPHATHQAPPPQPSRLLSAPTPPRQGFPAVTARTAVLVDADTGNVLWEKNAHARLPIASTTKIMTATLVLERLPLHSVVKVPAAAAKMPLVREGLRAGEHVAVWKLLGGLLIFSGNDDALTLAEATAGTRRSFVKLMNEKARELSMADTHFTSVSGVVDKGNYSSAWDLAALARYAMRDPRFRAVVATKTARVPWSAPTYGKVYVNKNQLLGAYRGANGVKTGWTTLAGHCLVASARRGNRSLIAVVLHSTDPYHDAPRLLNFGFALSR
jgi:serine-type D-Ala-D-Ala carboxypeptidase (penicillin-binding protein 5/6)